MKATIQVDLNVLPDDSADAIASYARSALLDWGLEIDGNVRVSVEAGQADEQDKWPNGGKVG